MGTVPCSSRSNSDERETELQTQNQQIHQQQTTTKASSGTKRKKYTIYAQINSKNPDIQEQLDRTQEKIIEIRNRAEKMEREEKEKLEKFKRSVDGKDSPPARTPKSRPPSSGRLPPLDSPAGAGLDTSEESGSERPKPDVTNGRQSTSASGQDSGVEIQDRKDPELEDDFECEEGMECESVSPRGTTSEEPRADSKPEMVSEPEFVTDDETMTKKRTVSQAGEGSELEGGVSGNDGNDCDESDCDYGNDKWRNVESDWNETSQTETEDENPKEKGRRKTGFVSQTPEIEPGSETDGPSALGPKRDVNAKPLVETDSGTTTTDMEQDSDASVVGPMRNSTKRKTSVKSVTESEMEVEHEPFPIPAPIMDDKSTGKSILVSPSKPRTCRIKSLGDGGSPSTATVNFKENPESITIKNDTHVDGINTMTPPVRKCVPQNKVTEASTSNMAPPPTGNGTSPKCVGKGAPPSTSNVAPPPTRSGTDSSPKCVSNVAPPPTRSGTDSSPKCVSKVAPPPTSSGSPKYVSNGAPPTTKNGTNSSPNNVSKGATSQKCVTIPLPATNGVNPKCNLAPKENLSPPKSPKKEATLKLNKDSEPKAMSNIQQPGPSVTKQDEKTTKKCNGKVPDSKTGADENKTIRQIPCKENGIKVPPCKPGNSNGTDKNKTGSHRGSLKNGGEIQKKNGVTTEMITKEIETSAFNMAPGRYREIIDTPSFRKFHEWLMNGRKDDFQLAYDLLFPDEPSPLKRTSK